MSIDVIAAAHVDQAHVDAASQRLAVALADDKTKPGDSPADAERGHAAVGAARSALAQAEASVNADRAAPRTVAQQANAETPGVGHGHLVEVTV